MILLRSELLHDLFDLAAGHLALGARPYRQPGPGLSRIRNYLRSLGT
jgi:hypothetical protein